ncbi:hypothetical protein CHS0354_001594 [Potamilus streckersoni]|uniref:Uncharacterized protein n=1 Tax=Potamilus streckersoni TaxID=2493646 RepID=A0AAE0RUK1_9BIVA|nr:hypothetical protein CHS0354_001594 [Potamilus streckersoni]
MTQLTLWIPKINRSTYNALELETTLAGFTKKLYFPRSRVIAVMMDDIRSSDLVDMRDFIARTTNTICQFSTNFKYKDKVMYIYTTGLDRGVMFLGPNANVDTPS